MLSPCFSDDAASRHAIFLRHATLITLVAATISAAADAALRHMMLMPLRHAAMLTLAS